MEKLNRAQKCSILGPQNLGSGGARAPGAPPGSAPELTRLMKSVTLKYNPLVPTDILFHIC